MRLWVVIAGAALVVLGAIAFYALRSRGESQSTLDGPISTWRIANSWSVARGQHEGKPIFTRFNAALVPLIGRAEFSKRIGVVVPLNDPTADGLPQGSELAQLNEIEDLLERRLTKRNESLFAGSITTNAMREFVLYSSNAEEAVLQLRQLAQEVSHHRLQWVVNDDPRWQVFSEFSGQ